MGGYGSGGHNNRGFGTVEGIRHLDLNMLRREGALTAGFNGSIAWASGRQSVFTCGVMTF